jgi:hypothetical protein
MVLKGIAMKKELVWIVLSLAFYYVVSVTFVAEKCQEHFGWGFESAFPVPTCNIKENKVPLENLEEHPLYRFIQLENI